MRKLLSKFARGDLALFCPHATGRKFWVNNLFKVKKYETLPEGDPRPQRKNFEIAATFSQPFLSLSSIAWRWTPFQRRVSSHSGRSQRDKNLVPVCTGFPRWLRLRDIRARPGLLVMACSAFQLDLTADFGTCKCGFKKAEHLSASTQCSPATPSKVRSIARGMGSSEPRSAPTSKPGSLPENPKAKIPVCPKAQVEGQTVPCAEFRVDVLAPVFGQCKCGFPKSLHETPSSSQPHKSYGKGPKAGIPTPDAQRVNPISGQTTPSPQPLPNDEDEEQIKEAEQVPDVPAAPREKTDVPAASREKTDVPAAPREENDVPAETSSTAEAEALLISAAREALCFDTQILTNEHDAEDFEAVSDADLPPGWATVPSGEGDFYYWHEETNEVTWKKPLAPSSDTLTSGEPLSAPLPSQGPPPDTLTSAEPPSAPLPSPGPPLPNQVDAPELNELQNMLDSGTTFSSDKVERVQVLMQNLAQSENLPTTPGRALGGTESTHERDSSSTGKALPAPASSGGTESTHERDRSSTGKALPAPASGDTKQQPVSRWGAQLTRKAADAPKSRLHKIFLPLQDESTQNTPVGWKKQPRAAGDGLEILKLKRGGIAESLGVQVGWVVVAVNGVPITNDFLYKRALDAARAQGLTKVEVTLAEVRLRRFQIAQISVSDAVLSD